MESGNPIALKRVDMVDLVLDAGRMRQSITRSVDLADSDVISPLGRPE